MMNLLVTFYLLNYSIKSDPLRCSAKSNFISAWFDGYSFDMENKQWNDKSENNNIGIINGTGINIFNQLDLTNDLYLNLEPVVYGTISTEILFGSQLNISINHTVFNLCKYRDGEQSIKSRIIQSADSNALFGHWNGLSGVAYEHGWLTQYSSSQFSTDWLLSTQSYDSYRGNGQDLTIPSITRDDYFNWIGRLAINIGIIEASEFGCAEILIVNNKVLNIDEIQCIEQYFSCKYNLGLNNVTCTQISWINNLLCSTVPDDYYNVSLYDCSQMCQNSDYKCTMFQYSNGSRCYIHDSVLSCNLTMSQNITEYNQSVIGYKVFDEKRFNYPLDWRDAENRSCIEYELNDWCDDEYILQNYTDHKYGYTANDVCSSCGGGVFRFDQVLFSVDNDWIHAKHDVLCKWNETYFTLQLPADTKYRNWDILTLYNLCNKLEPKNCNCLIDTEFDAQNYEYSLNLCENDNVTGLNFDFIMELKIDELNKTYEMYINILWFNFSLSYYTNSSDLNIKFMNNSECINNIYNENNSNEIYRYGIHQCQLLNKPQSPSTTDIIPPTEQTKKDGLNGGEIAGIVIGVVVFLFLLYHCRKKEQQKEQAKNNTTKQMELTTITTGSSNQSYRSPQTGGDRYQNPYYFYHNGQVRLCHFFGKYLQVTHDTTAGANGASGDSVRWNVILDGKKDGVKVVKFQNSKTNKYLRIYAHKDKHIINVGGTGGKWTRFIIKPTNENSFKFESVECRGKYIAVQPQGVAIGTGGKYTEFSVWSKKADHYHSTDANQTVYETTNRDKNVFVFQSDFDKNGILFAIGTNFGINKWVNPSLNGKVIITASHNIGKNSESLDAIVGRKPVRCMLGSGKDSWFCVNFTPSKIKICPTYYSLRHYSSWAIEALRSWDFEGSNDGYNWILIKKHKNDTKLKGKGCAASWPIECKSNEYFDKFRVKMTGPNDNKHDYLC
eukprot:205678_1